MESYVNRTIRIPIAEVLEGGNKQEFYADLRESLDSSRRAYNIVLASCYASDTDMWTTNTAKNEKASKRGATYFYPQISHMFPGVASVAASISRAAESKYIKDVRIQMLRGNVSVPNQRSYPWPQPKSIGFDVWQEGENIVAKLRLLGKAWKVKLAGGSNYRIHIARLRKIEREDIRDSEIWIKDNKATLGIAIRMIPETNNADRHMLVTSTRESLLSCILDHVERPYVITGDEVRKWQKERERRSLRIRQDMKTHATRKDSLVRLSTVSEKYNNRMDTLIHTVSSRVIEFAKRRNVGKITLDFTIKSYLPGFQWFDLATKIKYKCEDAGIECNESTLQSSEIDADEPCIYFAYSPSAGRVKIGKTSVGWNDRMQGGIPTDSAEELVLLAIDNQPKNKLTVMEKHHHAAFAEHRWRDDREWFKAEPVIEWLREVGWFGNAGNRSQISQVMDI